MIGLIEKNPNVLVIKDFSKIHAMAGLRIGYIIGTLTSSVSCSPIIFKILKWE
jgi:histidinol-phosphate/aromatic aminotransferase/cobyric acid decarboxylase-like protein